MNDRFADSTTADDLRTAVLRLARLIRQQDDADIGPTATAVLAALRARGPQTLGQLAALERVAPPTMTKVAEQLETHGFVTRAVDVSDRRVTKIRSTRTGAAYLERTLARRTAWLSERLDAVAPRQLAHLASTVDLLEALVDAPDGNRR
jgi:DNA-binding MarR family transcriptional regulator